MVSYINNTEYSCVVEQADEFMHEGGCWVFKDHTVHTALIGPNPAGS